MSLRINSYKNLYTSTKAFLLCLLCSIFVNKAVFADFDTEINSDSEKLDVDYYGNEYLYDLESYSLNQSLQSSYLPANFAYRTTYGSLDGYQFLKLEELKLKVEENGFGLSYESRSFDDFVDHAKLSRFSVFGDIFENKFKTTPFSFRLTVESNAKFEKKFSDIGAKISLVSNDLELFFLRATNVYAFYNSKEKNGRDYFRIKPWNFNAGLLFSLKGIEFELQSDWSPKLEWVKNSRKSVYERSVFAQKITAKKSFEAGIIQLNSNLFTKNEKLNEIIQKRRDTKLSLEYLGSTERNWLSYELFLKNIDRKFDTKYGNIIAENEKMKSESVYNDVDSYSDNRQIIDGHAGITIFGNRWNIGLNEQNSHVGMLGLSAAYVRYSYKEFGLTNLAKTDSGSLQTWQSKALSGWEFRFKKYGVVGLNISWDVDNLARKVFYGTSYASLWDGGNFQMGLVF